MYLIRKYILLGITDSVMHPGTISFVRFDYPSRISLDTGKRMKEITEKIIPAVGLDNGMFIIDFFYDPDTGDISIIEINPRRMKKGSSAEVDYVISRRANIYPIEVKSGPVEKMRSMHLLLKEYPEIGKGFVLSFKIYQKPNFGKLIYMPLYSALN